MKEILLAHLKQYPQMQLQDVVKLLYQSEFGGGHMITSPEKSLDRLKEEYKSFKWEYSTIICEPIGGEMYRIYLSALEDGLSEETLNRMFTETAARASGTREGFEEKLRCLLQCCRSGELPFTLAQAEAFLDTYRKMCIRDRYEEAGLWPHYQHCVYLRNVWNAPAGYLLYGKMGCERTYKNTGPGA